MLDSRIVFQIDESVSEAQRAVKELIKETDGLISYLRKSGEVSDQEIEVLENNGNNLIDAHYAIYNFKNFIGDLR